MCCDLCQLLLVLSGLAIVFVLLKYLLQPGMWHADGPVMRGKTVIVTGASSGIGIETAKELVRLGAKVIMACRDLRKAEEVKRAIVDELKDQIDAADLDSRLVIHELDLTVFASVRTFAETINRTEKRLDVLINNAGYFAGGERLLTKEGLEMNMATNHFGHFLLTNLLLPLLKSSAPSRIVVVSSDTHLIGKIDFNNLNCEKSYYKTFLGVANAYSNSKLANILFTRQLADMVKGDGVTVTAGHPGMVATDGFRKQFPQWLINLLTGFLIKTPYQGAQTSIYLAASQSPEALVSGAYYSNCKQRSLKPHAMDMAVAKKLWEVSEKITQLA